MKKSWIGRGIIAAVVVILLVIAGFAIYQVGYTRGALADSGIEGFPARSFGRFTFPENGSEGLSMPFQGRSGFTQGAPMRRSPLGMVLPLAFFAGLLYLLFRLFRGRGWQLTFNRLPENEPGTTLPEPEIEED